MDTCLSISCFGTNSFNVQNTLSIFCSYLIIKLPQNNVMKGLDRHLRCVKDSKYLSYAALKGFCVCLATKVTELLDTNVAKQLSTQNIFALDSLLSYAYFCT